MKTTVHPTLHPTRTAKFRSSGLTPSQFNKHHQIPPKPVRLSTKKFLVYQQTDTSLSPKMTEETHALIMTGGDETMVHSASQTPGPIETSTIGSQALGQLTRGCSKTPAVTFV